MKRKLNMGMVGSLRDAFVGRVHRMAARLDAEIELVAGAFSADSEKAKRFGEDLLLNSQRVYRDYQTMAEAEAKLPIGRRIDFVSIVTPNHLHFPVAKLFLEAGINVVCDKPMTFDPDAPRQVLRRGKAYLSDSAMRATRLPTGCPEAFIEAFANLYCEAAQAIQAEVNGEVTPQGLDFPTVEDGLKGMAFIDAAVQSAKDGGIWTKMPAYT
jgi:predicted dehydrogenase